MPSQQGIQHNNCCFVPGCDSILMWFNDYDIQSTHTCLHTNSILLYLCPHHHCCLHSAYSAWTSWACPCWHACDHRLTRPHWSQSLTHWASNHPSVCSSSNGISVLQCVCVCDIVEIVVDMMLLCAWVFANSQTCMPPFSMCNNTLCNTMHVKYNRLGTCTTFQW